MSGAWPKLATLTVGEIACKSCGVSSREVNVTYVPSNNAFKAECTSCEAYLKWLSVSAFKIGQCEPKPSWIVLGQSADDPSVDEVLAVCATESQALEARNSLAAAGFISTKISEVPA